MQKLTLNSISNDVFRVSAAQTADRTQERADIVAEGRVLFFEHARNGQEAMHRALNRSGSLAQAQLKPGEYKRVNETFQREHLLYAARQVCAFTGEKAPEDWEQFRKSAQRFYGNSQFYAVLQGLYQEVINPILPSVYSEAVSLFCDVVEVGFGETYQLSVTSNDIPVFQDTAWGATRSVPANRFYSRDYTLNPSPRTCEIRAKWTQLVGNGTDFGAFFANLAAGLYAKVFGMWAQMLAAAASDTTLIPSGLSYVFNDANWATAANKVSAMNSTSINNLIAYGNAVALSKVKPNTSDSAMDAAIATLLGREYENTGYLGNHLGVRLMPVRDAIKPGTQYNTVDTVMDSTKIWMMAANARKPMVQAFNSAMPLTIELTPDKTASMEVVMNITTALDSVAVFADKCALITLS